MLVASASTDRLLCCPPDLMKLLQMSDPSRWLTRHVVYGVPLLDKRSYAMPSLDISCQIWWIPTYTESITPMRIGIDIESSLINLIIHYFTWLLHSTFFLPRPRAYCLGQFEFKTLFLLRSYYENAHRWESGGKFWAVARALQGPPRPN